MIELTKAINEMKKARCSVWCSAMNSAIYSAWYSAWESSIMYSARYTVWNSASYRDNKNVEVFFKVFKDE